MAYCTINTNGTTHNPCICVLDCITPVEHSSLSLYSHSDCQPVCCLVSLSLQQPSHSLILREALSSICIPHSFAFFRLFHAHILSFPFSDALWRLLNSLLLTLFGSIFRFTFALLTTSPSQPPIDHSSHLDLTGLTFYSPSCRRLPPIQ